MSTFSLALVIIQVQKVLKNKLQISPQLRIMMQPVSADAAGSFPLGSDWQSGLALNLLQCWVEWSIWHLFKTIDLFKRDVPFGGVNMCFEGVNIHCNMLVIVD